MLKTLAAALALFSFAATTTFAGDVTPPLPHKTTLKTGANCNTPQGKSRKECAPTTQH